MYRNLCRRYVFYLLQVYFDEKIQLFVNYKSEQDPDSHWFGSLDLDPGPRMGKKSGSVSGMNNLDHISKSLETIFGLKYLISLMRDPGWKLGWKKFGSGIIKHPGSATLNKKLDPDPH